MTREETILRLLSFEPAARADLIRDTGWGIEETNTVVDGLVRTGLVVSFPTDGNNGYGARRLCLPQARAAALDERRSRAR